MTKTAHTPGPWDYHWDGEGGAFVSGSGSVIADMVGPVERRKANARLIAAAPELMAAVKDARSMLASVEVIDGEDGDPWSKALARMDTAIAKAEGA